MSTLTDKQIDPLTAKYFCIFADKQAILFLQQATDSKSISLTALNLVKKSAISSSLNESEFRAKTSFLAESWFSNAIDKATSLASKMKSGAKNELADIVAKTTSSSAQAAIDTATSAANLEKLASTASKTSKAAVDSAVSALLSNKDALNLMAKDSSSSATQGAIDTLAANNLKLNAMAKDAGASATQGAIDTAAANSDTVNKVAHGAGEAAAAGALGALKGAAKGAMSAAMPWLIGAAVTTIGAFLWPKVKGMFKKMFRASALMKNSLAFVKFLDVNENKWQFYFSKDKMVWKLDNMDSGEDVTHKEILAFIETNFAKQFMLQCLKYIRNVLDNLLNINILAKQYESDSALKEYFKSIVDNKDRIYDRMFNGKF